MIYKLHYIGLRQEQIILIQVYPAPKHQVSNQIRYFVDFYCEIHLTKPQLQYFWFVGLDSSWRRKQDVPANSVEGHFGIFNDDCIMKPHFQTLSFSCGPLFDEEQKNVIFKMPDIAY